MFGESANENKSANEDANETKLLAEDIISPGATQETTATQETPVIPDRLNSRQRAFVEEYIKDSNATQAYIRAGYSPDGARIGASKLLHTTKVAEAVVIARAQRIERANISVEKVLQEVALLAESDVSHYLIDDYGNVTLAEGAPAGAMRAVQSIKKKTRILEDGTREYNVELRLWDKPTPLRLLGRHVGLFTDKVEVVGKDGGPIQIAAARLADMTPEQLAEVAENLAIKARELLPS